MVRNRNRDKLGDTQLRHKAASIFFKSGAICAINLFYECRSYDIYYRAPFSHVLCKPTTGRFYACYFIAVLGDSFLIKGTYTGSANNGDQWARDTVVITVYILIWYLYLLSFS